MTPSQWSDLVQPVEVARALMDLYRLRGRERYDEVVTQTEHALQCASLAMRSGSEDSTVVAALLHDVGHLLIPDEKGSETDRHHEVVGARFLGRWFGEDVLEPIRYHVAAKRYLCAVEPPYFSTLSAGSVRSLEMQGGPMDPSEVIAFETNERHQIAVDLRRWDESAKYLNAPTPDLGVFEPIIVDVLCRS